MTYQRLHAYDSEHDCSNSTADALELPQSGVSHQYIPNAEWHTNDTTLMTLNMTAETPLLMHWSYHSQV